MRHAALFLLAAAWTLQAGGHVRVDIFYAQASPAPARAGRSRRRAAAAAAVRARADVAVAALCRAVLGDPRALAAKSSGLPLVFVLKTLIPLFALLMALQGVAQAIRARGALHRGRR